MYRIAICGKGGVGKSTVAANLSYILSKRGKKILHVGCDPKHDSTRLLTNGVPQSTYLDYLFDDPNAKVIVDGANGISCVECGGAEPGIGCAGKGMMGLFKYLEENSPEDVDIRVCDILGDVVCGGFAVPLRKNNVDGIIIVVSEDFMSIYAANNILNGIKNLADTPRILGLVLNSRNETDRGRVIEFARATGLEILSVIPNDEIFTSVEEKGLTAAEAFSDSEAVAELIKLADIIESASNGDKKPVSAIPLSDEGMMQIATCQKVTDYNAPKMRKKCYFDLFDEEQNNTHIGPHAMAACSSHGAVELLLGITDAAVVLNGPSNCGYLMEYIFRRKSVQMANDKQIMTPCNLYSTCLDENALFKGDGDAIRKTVERAFEDGFRTIFVVNTCSPEIIGTDLESELSKIDLEGAQIIIVPESISFLSSKFGGFKESVIALSTIIDHSKIIEPDTVCLLSFEINCASHRGKDQNRKMFDELLENYGLKLKTFLRDCTTVDEIRNLDSCQYVIQINRGSMPSFMSETLFPNREVSVLDSPMSLKEIEEWCDFLSKLTDREGGDYLERKTKKYYEEISKIRPLVEGKKAIIYTRKDKCMNPQIDTLMDLGMGVCGILAWKQLVDYHDPWVDRYPLIPRIDEVDLCELGAKTKELGADLIVSGDLRTGRCGLPWFRYPNQYLGAECAIELAHRIRNALLIKPKLDWRD